MIAFLVIGTAFLVLMLSRSEAVFRARINRLNAIAEKIRSGNAVNYRVLYRNFDTSTRWSVQMLQLHKWTYKQFYPEDV